MAQGCAGLFGICGVKDAAAVRPKGIRGSVLTIAAVKGEAAYSLNGGIAPGLTASDSL